MKDDRAAVNGEGMLNAAPGNVAASVVLLCGLRGSASAAATAKIFTGLVGSDYRTKL